MQQFEVTFSLGQYEDPNRQSGWASSSAVQYLTTRVQAQHYSQAQQMVESQYGGSRNCCVHRVIIV